ncbi:hypothetical protein K1719_009845 [Acacia pycnantha]|nr:hypothetical protein K1719_009845 [Acacia pycnantha]
MEYVVFHGSIDAQGPEAYQEYYIRHADGSLVKSDAERQRLVQCIEAAIERRVSEGVTLELFTADRLGLLSDVTRIFRENSLDVTRAQVVTKKGKAVNTFYIRGASQCPIDSNSIESIRQIIGNNILKVKGVPIPANSGNPCSTLVAFSSPDPLQTWSSLIVDEVYMLALYSQTSVQKLGTLTHSQNPRVSPHFCSIAPFPSF